MKQVVFKHYMLFTKLNYMEILFIYCFLQLKVKNLYVGGGAWQNKEVAAQAYRMCRKNAQGKDKDHLKSLIDGPKNQ